MADALEDLINARTPADIFGRAKGQRAKKIYTRLLRVAHPDYNKGAEKRSTEAYNNLNNLWDKLNGKTPLPAGIPAQPNTVVTRKHTYEFGKKIWQADGTAYFEATYDGGTQKAYIAFPTKKVFITYFNTGKEHLKTIRNETPDQFKAYYPRIIDIFEFTNNGEQTPAYALEHIPNLYTLQEILNTYPQGIDGKDVAWIYRRALIAVGNTHEQGYIHNGPHLTSILIEPDQHGLILKDWQYSIPTGNTATILAAAAKDDYSHAVQNKETLTPAEDMSLLAHAMLRLLDSKAPKRLTRFFKGMVQVPAGDARHALADFDELLSDLYGPRKFHPFTMPPRT